MPAHQKPMTPAYGQNIKRCHPHSRGAGRFAGGEFNACNIYPQNWRPTTGDLAGVGCANHHNVFS